MCGILGTFGADIDRIEKAYRLMSHRGPDDSGVFYERKLNIALGHQRLSILDLSNLGHQPMVNSDNDVIIVFNGEIYNFRELRSDLEAQGFTFNGNSDTEVLLKLYLSEGPDLLSKLNGIFAFAILDLKSQSILLARDSFGVKPLYYSENDNTFCFASEIKALLALIPTKKEINIEAIDKYISFLYCPGKETPLNSVNKLLPGEAMIVSKGQIEKKWLWYTSSFFNQNISKLNQKKAINGVEERLRKAVHRQMISDVPLGAFLSGGLDSSSIVTFAREVNPDIKCFSIETSGPQDKGFIDDLPYAKKVAKHLNVSLDIISINSQRMAQDLEDMVIQLDEPLADPAALNVLYISQLAKSQGIKVLLSGAGGDDLFSGYRRHQALYFEKFWRWMLLHLRKKLKNFSSNDDSSVSYKRRLEKMFSGADLNDYERLINYFRWTDKNLLRGLYSKEFQKKLETSDSNNSMLKYLSNMPKNISPLNQMLALEQRFFLTDHNLNYTDKMSMALGVETRVPFLDQDLVIFTNKLQDKYKQKRNESKWILKKTMEPFLPKEIIYRPKTGFGAPLRGWMRNELREILSIYLSVESINKRKIFSAPAIHQLILDNDRGKIDASYTLLSLLCIEIWCRAYLD